MTEQDRVQRPSVRPAREKADYQEPVNAPNVAEISERIRASEAVIDDIVADFVQTEERTEIIGGANRPRPQLRQTSSEDFVKGFRQQEGQ